MTKRKLGPIVLATALGIGAGCQRHFAQAANPMVAAAPLAAPTTPAPFATPPVLPGTPDVATLVAKVTPAVVNITTIHDVRAPQQEFEFPFGFDPFGAFPGMGRKPRGGSNGGDQVFRQRALGSGFIVDTAGHVVTNAHVVEDADQVRVKLADEREFDAKVKGRDPKLDVAVLELVGASNLPSVSLGSSEALRVGEYVVAIGNPFGLGNTVTMGIVSAKSRAIGAGPYDDFIQTDASINPGNSGGPLFNLLGQVVGINTAIAPQGKGIGFAIPVDALKDVLPQLVSAGHVARGRLGVAIQSVDPTLAKALGLDRPKGAMIAEVEPGGPADRAGLKPGDLIVRVDQTEILHSGELPRTVARHAPGSKVKVEYLRERTQRTIEVTLDELREERVGRSEQAPQGSPAKAPPTEFGVSLVDVPGQGVVVDHVLSGGPADGKLEHGDVIVEVNHAPVSRAADVAKHVAASPAGKPVLFKTKRENVTRFVAIERR
jgi:serine protease Do